MIKLAALVVLSVGVALLEAMRKTILLKAACKTFASLTPESPAQRRAFSCNRNCGETLL